MSRVINAAGEILVSLAPYGGRSVAAPATLTAADIGTYVFVTVAGTITLPAVADVPSFIPMTIKVTGTTPVNVVPNGSEKIDDDSSKTIAFQYSAMTIISDGSQWRIV